MSRRVAYSHHVQAGGMAIWSPLRLAILLWGKSHHPSLSTGTSKKETAEHTNPQFPFKRTANSAQAGYGYKDQCSKLADVRRNDTAGLAAAIPCRRSHSCRRVVVDRDKGHQHKQRPWYRP